LQFLPEVLGFGKTPPKFDLDGGELYKMPSGWNSQAESTALLSL
jgi:hypothetical protein